MTLSGTYTIAMVDADIVGTDLAEGENRHWLVNGATISSMSLSYSLRPSIECINLLNKDSVVTTTSGTAITAYAGPGPAAGSGPHRHVLLFISLGVPLNHILVMWSFFTHNQLPSLHLLHSRTPVSGFPKWTSMPTSRCVDDQHQ